MPDCSAKRQSPSNLFGGNALSLTLAFMLLTIAPGLPLGGQSTSEKGGRTFDLFQTVPQGSSFDFSGEFSLPAGFFGEGSERFSGKVALKGLPLHTFRDHKAGDADAIIERRPGLVPASKYPSEQKAEIELAALSLQSTSPIRVRSGKKTEAWNVKVELSPSHPSIGSVTIKQLNAEGGTADWDLPIYPLFTFTRQTDKVEKKLDVGTLRLKGDAVNQLTLRVRNTPWSTKAPRGTVGDGPNDGFFLGVQRGIGEAVTANAAKIVHVWRENGVTHIHFS